MTLTFHIYPDSSQFYWSLESGARVIEASDNFLTVEAAAADAARFRDDVLSANTKAPLDQP